LALVAPSVEEAWAAVAAGRTAVAIAPSNAADARGAATWADALQRLPDGAPLKRLLAHLLGEAASGIPTDTLDARLDEALPRLVPPEMAAHALRETELALAEFKTRMRPEEFEKTFARALADRLRDALYLPRLRSPR